MLPQNYLSQKHMSSIAEIESIQASIEYLKTLKLSYNESSSKNYLNQIDRAIKALLMIGVHKRHPLLGEIFYHIKREANPEKLIQLISQLIELISVLFLLSTKSHQPLSHSNILIVEDDNDMIFLYKNILRSNNREIIAVNSFKKASQIIETHQISLIILDIMLPNGDGRDFLISLRNHHKTKDTPIIVCSSIGPKIESECYMLGTDNYFSKPINTQTLSVKVAKLIEKHERIKTKSMTDPLTGLPNREAFNKIYSHYSALSKRYSRPLSIALLDIDNFKQINDTYGHLVGDQVLRQLSQFWTDNLRQSDFIARWGGEEFIILLPETQLNDAFQFLEKKRELLNSEQLPICQQLVTDLKITFSAGLAQMKSEGLMVTALQEADDLMYLAKESGKNKIVSSHMMNKKSSFEKKTPTMNKEVLDYQSY